MAKQDGSGTERGVKMLSTSLLHGVCIKKIADGIAICCWRAAPPGDLSAGADIAGGRLTNLQLLFVDILLSYCEW